MAAGAFCCAFADVAAQSAPDKAPMARAIETCRFIFILLTNSVRMRGASPA
jgi:hypothetical protein